jgi:hypothetical protein
LDRSRSRENAFAPRHTRDQQDFIAVNAKRFDVPRCGRFLVAVGGQIVLIAWASPATILGIAVGLVGLATRGRVQRHGRVLEFWGGAITWLLGHAPLVRGAAALTLGHVVLGVDSAALDDTRDHERIHVAQYERWGPAFLPAYGLCSLALWLAGREPYWDNPFEREAYRRAP